jgi:hypothetical protein
MYDEDTGAEPKIVSASFADPFLLLFRDDSSIFVAQCDDDNELEELEREDDKLSTTKWVTGCLYADSTGAFAASENGRKMGENVMMFLLSAGGALHVTISQHEPSTPTNICRFTHCLTSRNLSILPKDSALFPRFYLRTMQLEDLLPGRIWLKY